MRGDFEHGVLIVSPHRDDAAFSCAIAIRELRKRCSVTVSNYFTVSEYAPLRTTDAVSITALRLDEDRNFAKLAGVTLADLDLVDAPQRLQIEFSQISNNRPLGPEDARCRQIITAQIAGLAPDLILLPLALGDHIDHRIAQAAAIDTGHPRLAFYEDLPYAARLDPGKPELRAHEISPLLTPWIFRAPDGCSWKAQCAGLYPSQIGAATVDEISQYGNRYQQGERFWVTEPAAEWLRAVSV